MSNVGTQPAARVYESPPRYIGTEVSQPRVTRQPMTTTTNARVITTPRRSVSPNVRIVGENRSVSPLSHYRGPSSKYNVSSANNYSSNFPTNTGTYVARQRTPSPINRAAYTTSDSRYTNKYANNVYQPTRGGGTGM